VSVKSAVNGVSSGEGRGGWNGSLFEKRFTEGQSVLTQFGGSGMGVRMGCANIMVVQTLSEPMEGRFVSHSGMKGAETGEAKARSRTEGLEVRLSGKHVKIPTVLTKLTLSLRPFSSTGRKPEVRRCYSF